MQPGDSIDLFVFLSSNVLLQCESIHTAKTAAELRACEARMNVDSLLAEKETDGFTAKVHEKEWFRVLRAVFHDGVASFNYDDYDDALLDGKRRIVSIPRAPSTRTPRRAFLFDITPSLCKTPREYVESVRAILCCAHEQWKNWKAETAISSSDSTSASITRTFECNVTLYPVVFSEKEGMSGIAAAPFLPESLPLIYVDGSLGFTEKSTSSKDRPTCTNSRIIQRLKGFPNFNDLTMENMCPPSLLSASTIITTTEVSREDSDHCWCDLSLFDAESLFGNVPIHLTSSSFLDRSLYFSQWCVPMDFPYTSERVAQETPSSQNDVSEAKCPYICTTMDHLQLSLLQRIEFCARAEDQKESERIDCTSSVEDSIESSERPPQLLPRWTIPTSSEKVSAKKRSRSPSSINSPVVVTSSEKFHSNILSEIERILEPVFTPLQQRLHSNASLAEVLRTLSLPRQWLFPAIMSRESHPWNWHALTTDSTTSSSSLPARAKRQQVQRNAPSPSKVTSSSAPRLTIELADLCMAYYSRSSETPIDTTEKQKMRHSPAASAALFPEGFQQSKLPDSYLAPFRHSLDRFIARHRIHNRREFSDGRSHSEELKNENDSPSPDDGNFSSSSVNGARNSEYLNSTVVRVAEKHREELRSVLSQFAHSKGTQLGVATTNRASQHSEESRAVSAFLSRVALEVREEVRRDNTHSPNSHSLQGSARAASSDSYSTYGTYDDESAWDSSPDERSVSAISRPTTPPRSSFNNSSYCSCRRCSSISPEEEPLCAAQVRADVMRILAREEIRRVLHEEKKNVADGTAEDRSAFSCEYAHWANHLLFLDRLANPACRASAEGRRLLPEKLAEMDVHSECADDPPMWRCDALRRIRNALRQNILTCDCALTALAANVALHCHTQTQNESSSNN